MTFAQSGNIGGLWEIIIVFWVIVKAYLLWSWNARKVLLFIPNFFELVSLHYYLFSKLRTRFAELCLWALLHWQDASWERCQVRNRIMSSCVSKSDAKYIQIAVGDQKVILRYDMTQYYDVFVCWHPVSFSSFVSSSDRIVLSSITSNKWHHHSDRLGSPSPTQRTTPSVPGLWIYIYILLINTITQ